MQPLVDAGGGAAVAGARVAAVEDVLDGEVDVDALALARDLDAVAEGGDRAVRPALRAGEGRRSSGLPAEVGGIFSGVLGKNERGRIKWRGKAEARGPHRAAVLRDVLVEALGDLSKSKIRLENLQTRSGSSSSVRRDQQTMF